MSLESKTKEAIEKVKRTQSPLWTLDQGISFSLLCKFVECRHRFWMGTVQGVAEVQTFNHMLEFGNFLHEGLDLFGRGMSAGDTRKEALAGGIQGIEMYGEQLLSKYPDDDREIEWWTEVIAGTFKNYIEYYFDLDKGNTYLLHEEVFSVPVQLPSGRTIKLNGKFDGSFYRQLSKDQIKQEIEPHWYEGKKQFEVFLQENKGKGKIDEEGIGRGLTMEAQTMIYLTALLHSDIDMFGTGELFSDYFGHQETLGEYPQDIEGMRPPSVLYNVIRRPLAGGVGNQIVQKKGREVNKKGPDGKPLKDNFGNNIKERVGVESDQEFRDRVISLSSENPSLFFIRWEFRPSWEDLITFQRRWLVPILESVCDWWESIEDDPFNPWETKAYLGNNTAISDCKSCGGTGKLSPGSVCDCYWDRGTKIPNKHHWQRAFGIYSSLEAGWRGDFFDYVTTGSILGLEKRDTVFPELPELNSK